MAAIRSQGNKATELKLASILRAARITGWRRRHFPATPILSSAANASLSLLTAASGTAAGSTVANRTATAAPTRSPTSGATNNATSPSTALSPQSRLARAASLGPRPSAPTSRYHEDHLGVESLPQPVQTYACGK